MGDSLLVTNLERKGKLSLSLHRPWLQKNRIDKLRNLHKLKLELAPG